MVFGVLGKRSDIPTRGSPMVREGTDQDGRPFWPHWESAYQDGLGPGLSHKGFHPGSLGIGTAQWITIGLAACHFEAMRKPSRQ
jgi:hypothetical protein